MLYVTYITEKMANVSSDEFDLVLYELIQITSLQFCSMNVGVGEFL